MADGEMLAQSARAGIVKRPRRDQNFNRRKLGAMATERWRPKARMWLCTAGI